MVAEKGHYTYEYPRPSVTTDCVIFGYDGSEIKVLLIQRGIEPFKDQWAFPGGFLQMEETSMECAKRELKEETGLENAFLQQFHTFTDINRDPRGRVITIAYLALVKISEVKGGDDASNAAWFSINKIPKLAFDHDMILRMAFSKLKERMHFESILEVHFDRANFAKKMLAMDILDETGERSENASRRVPKMYRFNLQKYEAMKSKGFKLEF